jgi:hypothetical protein
VAGSGQGLAAIASAAAALGMFGFFAGAVALGVGAAPGSASLARAVAALIAVASYLISALARSPPSSDQPGPSHSSTYCSATNRCSTGSAQPACCRSSPSRSP